MTSVDIRGWLDSEWESTLSAGEAQTDPEIDSLVNSKVASIRYALVTQILGKIDDPSRSLMALQLEAGGDGAWDARSFSTSIVVPWVTENQHVLGTSAEPYASKPLRRGRLEPDMQNVRAKAEWRQLYDLFDSLERSSLEEVKNTFRRVLRSIARRLAAQNFCFSVPQRISVRQLSKILDDYLGISSGGLRPLAISVALFTILGKAYSLYTRIESQGINQADTSSGMLGDIVCYGDSGIKLVVEVKDQKLTLAHIRASSRKVKLSGSQVANLLFVVPSIDSDDEEKILQMCHNEWTFGLNIHTINVSELSASTFTLLGEEWRVKFLQEVGDELDRRGDAQARMGWNEVLTELTR